jgi:CheY-like chemotaxis protein
VADDNADMRSYIGRLLGQHCDLQTVADGKAALAAIRGRRTDLVLTDIMMPRLDGMVCCVRFVPTPRCATFQ